MRMLKVTRETPRLYETEYAVVTIQLGDGGTDITTVNHEEAGMGGVAFSEAKENLGVGAYKDDLEGKGVDEIGAYLQILTPNIESLDVLIDKLIEARYFLRKMQKSSDAEKDVLHGSED
jgi:hypothetical protein